MSRLKGFTLIELLVVVAIIGILASIVLVALNSTRGKAKNTRIQSDANQIRILFEAKSSISGVYPGNADNGTENLAAAPWTSPPYSDLITDINNQGGTAPRLKVWQGPGKYTFGVYVLYTDIGGFCSDYSGGNKVFTAGTSFTAGSNFARCSSATAL